jgi:molybdopterin molybdotransferase
MLSVEQALDQILSNAKRIVETEEVPLKSANGRVLANDITAQLSIPPFDQSAMDGYAVKFDEIPDSRTMPVKQRVPAGQAPNQHIPDSAARIFTGAAVPRGADCVVIQENVTATKESIVLGDNFIDGQNIRLQGSEVTQGDLVVAAGARLDPFLLGICATHGLAQITVFKKLRVGVMSTGDELLEPGMPLDLGKIYNSSRYLLQGLIENMGMKFIDLGIIGDSHSETIAAISHASDTCDVLLTTGGVSVGEEDYVKNAIDELGELNVWKLAIKPGKPLAFGHANNMPVFGLPGNPVSSLVTFLILARPYLRTAQGRSHIAEQNISVAANFDRKAGMRQEYLRVKIEDNQLKLFNNQSSARLSSAGWADGLAIQPPGKPVKKGQPLEFLSFTALLK